MSDVESSLIGSGSGSGSAGCDGGVEYGGSCIVCGDGSCSPWESCSTCASDCGACATCGDGTCNADENCSSCPSDCGTCPAYCGDGSCNGTESCSWCPSDCGYCPTYCGDGSCNGDESCYSCESDCGVCPPYCGDWSCNGDETCASCYWDCGACPPVCGDGTCNGGETCSTCASDCGACPPICGDGTCNGSEDCETCPSDCSCVCGDGVCDPSESCTSCAEDCQTCGNTILILSTTVTNGMSSVEATRAQALGYTVEVATPNEWAMKTTEQFASYRAIVLGDATCANLSAVQIAQATTSVWGPAITGNVLVVGTDPVWHQAQGGAQLTSSGIAFVAAGRETGAYIALSCYYHDVTPGTQVPLLSPFGMFTLRGVGCYNDAHIVVDHRALAGLSDANLSNWSCSVHEAFDRFPSTFVPLAIARGVSGPGSLPFSGGTFGVPYILARCEDCAVLQVFEENEPDPIDPMPSCTDVATWIAVDEPFDPYALSLGSYYLSSADLGGDHLAPEDVRYALHDGSLTSFYMMNDDIRTVCSFVATWDYPLDTQEWAVESPVLTPPDESRIDPEVCANGWTGHIAECQAIADAEFAAAGP